MIIGESKTHLLVLRFIYIDSSPLMKGVPMLPTILSAAGIFTATSLDYLVILLIVFAQLRTASHKRQAWAGLSLGIGILSAFSILFAFVLTFVPQDWMIGLLGLVPVYLGIHYILAGQSDTDEHRVIEKIKNGRLFWVIALITVTSGGDNLAIFTPYFYSLTWAQILLALGVFALGIIALVEISYAVADFPQISSTIEKHERWLLPVVLIGLGLSILVSNGTLQKLLEWIL